MVAIVASRLSVKVAVNNLCESAVVYTVVTHDAECFSGLTLRWGHSHGGPRTVIVFDGFRRNSRKGVERRRSTFPIVGTSAVHTHVVSRSPVRSCQRRVPEEQQRSQRLHFRRAPAGHALCF